MSSQLRNDPRNHAVVLTSLTTRLPCLPIPPECDDPVAFLVTLAAKMHVEENESDELQLPEMTLGRQGGDVDDVLLMLAVLGRQAGIKYRFRFETPRLFLEVRQSEAFPWLQVGPVYNPFADMASGLVDGRIGPGGREDGDTE